jgi:hypothetical protein
MSKFVTRIDTVATLLHDHPQVKGGFPDSSRFIEAIEEDIGVSAGEYSFHPKLMSDIKSLKISHDVWLLWWKNIFIGQFTDDYYTDGRGIIEYIDDPFWNDLLVSEKPFVFDENWNVHDLKIRATDQFVEYLKTHDRIHDWYDLRYKRPEGLNDVN